MEIRKKMLLSVIAVTLFFTAAVQSQATKSKGSAAVERQASSLVWGAERLGTAQELSPESKIQIRKLVRDGGLFFNANEMRDILNGKGGSVAACDSDCHYCCCDSDGRNCRCCD